MRRNTRSTIYDALVTLGCLAAAFGGIFLFVREFNDVFSKLDEEPIATVTYKHKAVQRKLLERVLWDRPRQGSPIYHGDTLRTSDAAQATVHFSDGASFDLDENTIMTISAPGLAERELKLMSGRLVARNGSSGAALSVRSGKAVLRLGRDSELSAVSRGDGGSAGFGLYAGSGEVEAADGSLVRLKAAEGVDVSKEGMALGMTRIIAVRPLPDELFLKQGPGDVTVTFRLGVDPGADYALEVSQDKDFTALRTAVKAVDGETRLAFPAGAWHWRVRDLADGSVKAQERFRVLDAIAPEAIAPAPQYEYRYRSKMPAVRFIWSGNDYADYWRLVVADNPALENPVVELRVERQSAVISDLGEGLWHWQVRPWYSLGLDGYGEASLVSSFAIRRSGALLPPEPMVPAYDALISTKNAKGKSLYFSWKNVADALAFRFELADNPDMRNPFHAVVESGNAIKVDLDALGPSNRRWYWRVLQTDTEGNESTWSPLRSFVTVDAELVHRLLFPPDGYSITENLAFDTRFSWQSDLPTETVFQISDDPAFKKLQYSKAKAGFSTDGGKFPIGRWYWRILSVVEGVEVKTPGRMVEIVPLFQKPSAISPVDSSGVAQFPGALTDFSWTAVENAGFYNFSLYSGNDMKHPVREYTGLEDTVLSLDFQGLPEGDYLWTVQAMAEETPLSTRRVGEIAEYRFRMRKLRPVELLAPGNGATISGVDAFLSPIVARWSSVEKVALSRFVLSKTLEGLSTAADGAGSSAEKPVMVVENPGERIVIPRLPEGKYSWTIIAETEDGFHISPPKPRGFTVSPIPALPVTGWMVPDAGKTYDFDYFKANRTIKFEWAPVNQANEYAFVISDEKGAKILSKAFKSPLFILDDLSLVKKGSYRWTVQALRRLVDGYVLQASPMREGSFIIDLPDVKAPQSLSTTNVYGR